MNTKFSLNKLQTSHYPRIDPPHTYAHFFYIGTCVVSTNCSIVNLLLHFNCEIKLCTQTENLRWIVFKAVLYTIAVVYIPVQYQHPDIPTRNMYYFCCQSNTYGTVNYLTQLCSINHFLPFNFYKLKRT